MTDHDDTTDDAEATAIARRLFARDEPLFATLTVPTAEAPDPDDNPAPTGLFATTTTEETAS
ncbi:hypothetical protein ABLG96_13875 [Nakamurella sp. A5-74]|uniref:Uncharacterized protein n=1 Tax=Nakamurella sp. A5-74 TaxID=3158264 RepID=A0AAU8DJI0_9ACTN